MLTTEEQAWAQEHQMEVFPLALKLFREEKSEDPQDLIKAKEEIQEFIRKKNMNTDDINYINDFNAGKKAAKNKMDLPPGASLAFTEGWESHWTHR